MKNLILFLFTLISFSFYCQKPDISILKPEIKPTFKGEAHVFIKVGMTCNTINKTYYKELNDGLNSELYKPDNISFFINPNVSIGVEAQIKKHFGFHFNIGFYQTLQKYNTIANYQLLVPGYHKKYNQYTQETKYEYLNNNVFLELLPSFHFKHTRILVGFNATRSTPTIRTKTSVKNLTLETEEIFSSKEKQEENYHVYSMLGIMQGFPVKKHEFIISATYFGFLKKYDSGLNLAIGFMF